MRPRYHYSTRRMKVVERSTPRFVGKLIPKGYMVKVSVKSEQMDVVRYFTKDKSLKDFLRYTHRYIENGKIIFKQYRVN